MLNIGALVVRLPRGYQITTQQIELAQALAHQATLAAQLTRLAQEAKLAAIAREQEKAAQERASQLAKANNALKRSLDSLAQQPELQAFFSVWWTRRLHRRALLNATSSSMTRRHTRCRLVLLALSCALPDDFDKGL